MSFFVRVSCPDCGHGEMNKRDGEFGKYLACQVLGCRGRRKVTDDWTPLDRAEDSATRKARMAAHAAFDPLWQTAETHYDETINVRKIRKTARGRCYRWLAAQLGVAEEQAHMNVMDRETCDKATALCKAASYPLIREWCKANLPPHAKHPASKESPNV